MKKRRIVSLLLAAAILAAALTGCANLGVGLMLLQTGTRPGRMIRWIRSWKTG